MKQLAELIEENTRILKEEMEKRGVKEILWGVPDDGQVYFHTFIYTASEEEPIPVDASGVKFSDNGELCIQIVEGKLRSWETAMQMAGFCEEAAIEWAYKILTEPDFREAFGGRLVKGQLT